MILLFHISRNPLIKLVCSLISTQLIQLKGQSHLKVMQLNIIAHTLSSVLPQAPARLGQAASSAVQSRRNWQTGLRLMPLCSLEHMEGGSQGGGRKRRGGSKGTWGRHARGWLPVILQARALNSPLLIMG